MLATAANSGSINEGDGGAAAISPRTKRPLFTPEIAKWLDVLYQFQSAAVVTQSFVDNINDTGSLGIATFQLAKSMLYTWFAIKPDISPTVRIIHVALSLYSAGTAGFFFYLYSASIECDNPPRGTPPCKVAKILLAIVNAYLLFAIVAAKVIKQNERNLESSSLLSASQAFPPVSLIRRRAASPRSAASVYDLPPPDPIARTSTSRFFQPAAAAAGGAEAQEEMRTINNSPAVSAPTSPVSKISSPGDLTPRNSQSTAALRGAALA